MGVNRAGYGIINDEAVQQAAHQEIIRRYFRCAAEFAMGFVDYETVQRAEIIMNNIGAKAEDRKPVSAARETALTAEGNKKGNEGIFVGAAIELKNGTIITGKNSPIMHAAASLILNASKHLAGLPDNLHLLPANIMNSLNYLKKEVLRGKVVSLDLEETLIALSISAISNPAAQMAMEKLKEMEGCEVHITHIPTPGDEAGLRKLGVNLTCDPDFSSKRLFIS